jgi:Kelch motif
VGFNQEGSTVIHRIPVAVPLMDRVPPNVGVSPYDPFLQNCFIERGANGKSYVIKRPGLVVTYTYNGGNAANGQGMAYYNNNLYAMGSNTLYRPALTSTPNSFSVGSGWSQQVNATWPARDNAACVVFQNKIFIIGGNDAGFVNHFSDVWSSADGVTWQQLVAVAPWGKRTFFQAVVFNNRLYVMGGRNGADLYNDVWVSDNGVDWNILTDDAAWAARVGFGAVAFNNGMFLIGGTIASGASQNDVWFSTDGAVWDEVVQTTAFTARQTHACITYNEKMWVIGGFGGGASLNDVYYSANGKDWTLATGGAFATGVNSLVAFEYAGTMWAIGGFQSAFGTYSSSVYKSQVGGLGAWTLMSGGPGFAARGNAMGCVFKAPTAISATNAPIMWFMGGITIAPTVLNDVWYSNADGSLSTSWAMATAAPNTEQWQFTTINSNQYLCLKNTYDFWYLYANQMTKVTDVNYPARTVPGVVNLNSTIYVMSPTGVISGCALTDPTVWNSLDFLTAEYEADEGVYLAKLQNYVVALKKNTTQFFYDSGQFPGISLRPVQNANIRIGCAAAGSVVSMDNTLIYMAQTFQAGRSIVMLNGFSPVKISNPYVDRLLDKDTLATVYSYSIKIDGHDFYILTMTNTDRTLAYDLVEKEWHVMTSTWINSRFRCNNYATDNASSFLQDEAVGRVYTYSPTTYQDNGLDISVSMMGDLVDFQSSQYKFCSRLLVVGDKYSSTNSLLMQWTDDNYLTLKGGISVDMSAQRPKIDRMGRFGRRGHYISHFANMPLRLEALELTIQPGDV